MSHFVCGGGGGVVVKQVGISFGGCDFSVIQMHAYTNILAILHYFGSDVEIPHIPESGRFQ